jgi:hypothetical protein
MANQTQLPLLDALPGNRQAGVAGLITEALRKFAVDDDNMIPAKVVNFDREKNLVTVQPLIMWVGMDDKNYSRKQIANLNCISLGGGGFHISFPLNEGDLGWIMAADRDIALFKSSLAESAPNTHRVHSFSDALFIPDVFRQYTINSSETAAMVIQSTDAATRIAIFPDQIHITAPAILKVTTPTAEFSADVHVKGNLLVDHNSVTTGATTANGGFTAAAGQACTLPATTTVNGKAVNGHVHTDPQGGSTGPF